MPSPFPGMNPYIEHQLVWHDFHERFIPSTAEMLGQQVLPRYFVKIDEHVYLREAPEDTRHFIGRADAAVVDAGLERSPATAVATAAAPAEVWQVDFDNERVSYLEIRDRDNEDVVTVIELLSPANKYGRDREAFLSKRGKLLWAEVHYVEIDLLRAGPRLPRREMQACDYYAIVSRSEERPRAGSWPIQLREPLPIVPIPLRHGDPDARLDLQSILHRIYDAAGYGYYIYKHPCDPPLTPNDQTWADELVAGR